jgi:hypothetical protein
MQLWWELHEKYEEKLLNFTQFETDEEFMEQFIHVDNSKPRKGKKKNAKKAKSVPVIEGIIIKNLNHIYRDPLT